MPYYCVPKSILNDCKVKKSGSYLPRLIVCSQEVVQQYRDRMKEINVRPIKKVVEAKARKKRRTIRRMEKAKKKADTISETMGMSDFDKAQQIRQYVSIFLPLCLVPSLTRAFSLNASLFIRRISLVYLFSTEMAF